jgi:DNA-binding NarL/FixJ family response regulator
MIRAGLTLILEAEPGLEVIAQCEDGRQLVREVTALRPDVALTDIRMPSMDGVEATRRIRALPDPPPVLALTTFDDDDVLWPVLSAGAAGFVLKDSPAESLVEAIRAVAAGGAWLDPRVLPRVLARARTQAAPAARQELLLRELTQREREVLELVCEGANNAEIATRLGMGDRTVKSHVSAILAKLGARDRAAAIVTAFQGGFAPPGRR